MPLIWDSNESAWNPRNCWIEDSSAVRSATDTMRQWSASSWSLKSPMTVWVFPASNAEGVERLLVQDHGRPLRRAGLSALEAHWFPP